LPKFLKILSLWLPVAVYLGLIYYFSSLSRLNFGWHTNNFPLHVIEYCILSVLIIRALNSGLREKVSIAVILLSFVLAIAYAITDEVHQSFVPNRTSSPLDVAADAIGALLGIAAITVLQRGMLKKGMNRK
jgi:VanZ family protein